MKYIFIIIFCFFSFSVNSENISNIKLIDLIKLQKESIIEKLIDKKLSGNYISGEKFLEIHSFIGDKFRKTLKKTYQRNFNLVDSSEKINSIY